MRITEEDLSVVTEELVLRNMHYTPKDYTEQEQLLAEILREMGIRFEQQVRFYRREKNRLNKQKPDFSVDFLLSSEGIVIEADGKWGHSRKADTKRDEELLTLGVNRIIHIKSVTKEEIREELDEKLSGI